MQVHYFHRDFMAISDPRSSFSRTNSIPRDGDSSRPSQVGGASTMRDDLPPLSLEGEQAGSPTSTRNKSLTHDQSFTVLQVEEQRPVDKQRVSRSQSYARTVSHASARHSSRAGALWKRSLLLFKARLYEWMDLVFIYLDIHLVKVIFLALMLLCVINVCAMHVPIMVMITPALWLSSRKQRFCVLFISTLISVYFMAKMVYQIDYISDSTFDVNCTTSGLNDTLNVTLYNNSEWLGFIKATKSRPLVVIQKGYIASLRRIQNHNIFM